MTLVIILAGIPGSGKSSALDETVKLFPELKVINYGDKMLEEASLQNIDKDALRKLPLLQQQKIGIAAAKRMAASFSEVVCIDTHAMIKTPLGYYPGIPEGVLRILNPNVIGMIECPAALIHERRKADKSRSRDDETVEQIEYHQQISRSFLAACCVISNALYTRVPNQAAPIEAARQLEHLIQSYKRDPTKQKHIGF